LRHIVLVTAMVAFLALVALRLLVPEQPVRLWAPALALGISLLAGLLLKSGRPVLATYLLGFGVWLAVLLAAALTQGVRAPIVMAFPLIIITVGWVASSRAAFLMAVLTVLSTAGLVLAENAKILPIPLASTATFYAAEQIVLYLVASWLVLSFARVYQARLQELNELANRLSTRGVELEARTRELKRAQVMANVGSWTCAIRTDIITPSTQTSRILGLPIRKTLSYTNYLASVHPEDHASAVQAWQLALKGQDLDHEHRINVHGTVKWVQQRAEIVFGPDGTALNAIGTTQDITERKLAQIALINSETRHRTLIEWSPEAVLVHRMGKILYVNPAAIRLFGAPYAQALMNKTTQDLIHPDYRDAQLARMRSICSHEKIPPVAESKFVRMDGSLIDVEVQGTAIDYDGDLAIHVAVRDITKRKEMENQVRQLAFFDSLTQLPNRRLLSDRLSQAIAATRRNEQFGAVMFLDLDNFKPLNDLFGHTLGDLLLVEVAQRLKSCVREVDTVARFGGDEFVIIVEGLASNLPEAVQLAHSVAHKIGQRLADTYTLEKMDRVGGISYVDHHCTASIGVVMLSKDDTSPDDLIKWADAAMYQAKSLGRNQVQFFEPHIAAVN
jgi:diguanylate cyclase (GGDEF)-like protein/PAS domain S-box-containing protein